MWGQLRIIQGGHLKIRGTGKNQTLGGIQNFLGGLKKYRRQGLQGDFYRRVWCDVSTEAAIDDREKL